MFRCTYAFHAREVRFERDLGQGFTSMFPEVFSFHLARHDPAELYLQLEDMWATPSRLAPGAGRRDSEEVTVRLLAILPVYLDGTLDRLAEGSRPALLRAAEDVAIFARIVGRFAADKDLLADPRLRHLEAHLARLAWRCLALLVDAHVEPEDLERHLSGDAREAAHPSEARIFDAIAGADAPDRTTVLLSEAESAYHRWLEDTCLETGNQVFETENSPFADRETEVLRAVCVPGHERASRGRELSPFLRRRRNKDCARLLQKLETWFLRQYDLHHAAVIIYHAANLEADRPDEDGLLSYHSPRNYALAIAALLSPFLGAAFLFERWPVFFAAACSTAVAAVYLVAGWFFFYRFCWRKDLTMFRAWVPRIFAGIIVGYLPVFLIDEVWDLASQPPLVLAPLSLLLAAVTLLYIYVEVRARIGDPEEAFARARGIFLVGVLEAMSLGLVVTSLLGPFMAERNWAPAGFEGGLPALATALPPAMGQLPMVLGLGGAFYAFPTALLLMTFLSFFIGTFLQLLWEDFPITEPL